MNHLWVRRSKIEITRGLSRTQKSLSVRFLKNYSTKLTKPGRHTLRLMPLVSQHLGSKKAKGQGHVMPKIEFEA